MTKKTAYQVTRAYSCMVVSRKPYLQRVQSDDESKGTLVYDYTPDVVRVLYKSVSRDAR